MKILFVAPDFFPHIGGVEKHIYELSTQLISDGHKVNILVEKRNPAYLDYEQIQNNLQVFRYNMVRIIGRFYNFIKFFRLFKEADVIHFHDFYVLWSWNIFICYILKAFMSKKLFITFHGWDGQVPPLKSIVYKRKLCERIADGNMCIGHYIEKWYGTNADIISYGGVHTYAEKDNIAEHMLLFLGRLEEDTGILQYVQAWKWINEKFPEWKFIICGDGSLRLFLEQYAYDNNLTNIQFEGFVANTDSYVRKAGIILTSGYLGILESFSSGKPVISFYDNQLKKDYLEMIPNSYEMMWITKSVEEIVESFQSIINKADLEKANRAKLFASNNSWNKVKNDYYLLWGKNK